MTIVLVTENIDSSGPELLKEKGFEVIEGWTLSEEQLAACADKVEAILVRTNRISSEQILSMPNLKVISKHGVGCDTIDVACARSRNITVAIASDANAQSVVEHTFMFMLNMAKIRFILIRLCAVIIASGLISKHLIWACALCWYLAMAGLARA